MKRAILLIAVLPAALAAAYLAGLDFSGSGEPGSQEQLAKDGSWEQLAKNGSWGELAKHDEYYQALFSPEALTRILSAKPTPVPPFSAGDQEIQIKNISEGKLYVSSHGPIQDLADVDWSATKYGRYYATQLHGLAGVGIVLEQQERLPKEVAEAIGRHIRDWARHSLENPEINPRAWYEGTVVKRQANLLQMLNYMRLFGPVESLDLIELLYILDRNAEYLLDTENVYLIGNHGIRQDLILAATAIALPTHPRAEEMLRLAEKRSEAMAHTLFTKGGIWLEHAPGYVYYMLRLLLDAKKLHAHSPEFNPETLLKHYDSSLSFLLAALTPDKRIPHVGSSGALQISVPVLGRMSKDGMSIDVELKQNERSLAAYPEYGYAIVRGDHPKGLYLLFVAAQNLPAGKRHTDDLSFILFNGGKPWITEGGHQSYELTGMTKYLRSPFAHSTYTLNGKYLSAHKRPELETELTEVSQRGEEIVLAGFSERFLQPATFERQIKVHDFSSLRIRDLVRSNDKEASWEGRFHFPPRLSVSVDGQIVTVKDGNGGQEMILSFDADKPLTFSTCHGQEKPICGFATSANDFGPATTLMWRLDGDHAEVDISISWNPLTDDQSATQPSGQ
jgi:hypothetical protein